MWTKTQLHLLFEVLYEVIKKSKHKTAIIKKLVINDKKRKFALEWIKKIIHKVKLTKEKKIKIAKRNRLLSNISS